MVKEGLAVYCRGVFIVSGRLGRGEGVDRQRKRRKGVCTVDFEHSMLLMLEFYGLYGP